MFDVNVIDEGDKKRQGTHRCPNCGRTVVINPHLCIGDPPQCPYCKIPYERKQDKWFPRFQMCR